MSERLRGAGWNVRTQDVSFPFYRERSARLTVDGRELRRGEDFRPIVYSGSGRAAGRARGVGNGCERSDFSGLGDGEIALAERGDCFFRVKAQNAERAGAGALLVADNEGGEVPAATLGGVGARIPALIVSADAGVAAGRPGGARRRRHLRAAAHAERDRGDARRLGRARRDGGRPSRLGRERPRA